MIRSRQWAPDGVTSYCAVSSYVSPGDVAWPYAAWHFEIADGDIWNLKRDLVTLCQLFEQKYVTWSEMSISKITPEGIGE